MIRRRAAAVGAVAGLILGATHHDAKAHVAGCHSRACDRRIHAKHRAHWKRTHIWLYRWHHLSAADRAWARCIAHFETFGYPWSHKARVNTGNGYFGAVQFSQPTASAAGFHSRPDLTTLEEQLVRAVWWRNRAGASQWSTSGNCR